MRTIRVKTSTVLRFTILLGVSCSPCTREVVDGVDSPDGSKQVLVYVVNCGATTGFVTRAVLRERVFKVFPRDTELLAIDGEALGNALLKIEWSSPNSVVVRYSAKLRATEAKNLPPGVTVKFEHQPSLGS